MLKCGYRFEDDELVEEILTEVEGERGALPLLAFALARLWEKRDRETGLLTRQAYHGIGGVGGALARHAEATVDRISVERIPFVRELFRNLVTAEGTRAIREWDELLSVFEADGGEGVKPSPTKTPHRTVGEGFIPSRDAASEVLRELIDARLLTSYEVREDEHKPIRRVEIIHESLLANWPRLVRWQTQDQEGAQLRDELRQSARVWDEHGRHDDRLWTGTAYREFRLWRERYSGGLTEVEEAFGDAMVAFAGRRRRKRRLIVAAVIAALAAGLVVVGSFWQRSVDETRRAEAANLLSLGQLELETYPSATVAYTIASLEQNDGPSARRLALEALWRGPTAHVATNNVSWGTQFSPDGQWLVQVQNRPEDGESHLNIFHADGTHEYLEDEHSGSPGVGITAVTDIGHFASWGPDSESSIKWVVWSGVEKQPLAETSLESPRVHWGAVVDSDRRRVVLLIRNDDRINVDALWFDGTLENLGTLDFKTERNEAGKWTTIAALDPRAGAWLGVVTGSDVYVVDVGDRRLGPPRLLGRHDGVFHSLLAIPWAGSSPPPARMASFVSGILPEHRRP